MKTFKLISRRSFIQKATITTGFVALGYDTIAGKILGTTEKSPFGEEIETVAEAELSESLPEKEYKSRFNALQRYKWKAVFADSGRDDWQKKWFLDGDRAKVENSRKGMTIHAGPTYKSEADHAVLWTKDIFEANNLKITFDFTRIDTAQNPNTVNIIYILAQGGGPKPLDILEWAHERKEPRMNYYYNFMDTYHVSYAVITEDLGNYIRGRRYMPSTGGALNGTELTPEYANVPLFEPGLTYKMTFIKTGRELFLQVKGQGKDMVFYFDTTPFPLINKGRIGLRQMYTRISRYSNFNVFVSQ